jgi:hypothetical protein
LRSVIVGLHSSSYVSKFGRYEDIVSLIEGIVVAWRCDNVAG